MKNDNKKIAIIGAGASGMMCALTAKRLNPNLDITLFEKNEKIGKKILASGNGRCNITNTNYDKTNYFGNDLQFIQNVLQRFSFKKFKEFCLGIGLVIDIKEDGKCYPLSNEAKSVVTLFEKALIEQNVNIKLNQEIQNVQYENGKYSIENEQYDFLVISSGLAAASQLGSSEDGLSFAEQFGHVILPTYPALVGLEFSSNNYKSLFGVKIKAKVQLYINGSLEEEVHDDILFTKYGVSGFAILDISTMASYALSIGSEVSISINCLPQYDRNTLFNLLKKLNNDLRGILPAKLIPFIQNDSIKKTVNNIQNLQFSISDTHGFKHAEASGGGIDTSEIDPNNMESKRMQNLYFTGEVLDVVGQRGGFNFAFAWASGYITGNALAV